mgnify:CR=1 FL=1
MWFPAVAAHLAARGAELLVVPNGSPFEVEKFDRRLALARARAAEAGVPLAYVNQVGGQDELVDQLLEPSGGLGGLEVVALHAPNPAGQVVGQAGLLVETLDAYVAANLNVKQAAEHLFVHTNTAHYRLTKIEEQTGKPFGVMGISLTDTGEPLLATLRKATFVYFRDGVSARRAQEELGIPAPPAMGWGPDLSSGTTSVTVSSNHGPGPTRSARTWSGGPMAAGGSRASTSASKATR